MCDIIDFMRICVSEPIIPISWGIHNIEIERCQIKFYVNGSRYQGAVFVKEEGFDLLIKLDNDRKKFNDVLQAIKWLDKRIEL